MNSDNKITVLITGGSGLIGRYLTSLLLSEGYDVRHLSRKANRFGKIRVFRWDPDLGILDPVVFEGVDIIIHLAGANIGEKRWSITRKKEIESSRVDSAKLIYKVLSENNLPVKTFISASAVGYYGSITSDRIFTEKDPPADDFLGNICRKWEEAADLFSLSGCRIVKIRTGVVMEKNDSALSRFLIPAKFGLFPLPGGGNQWIPWIHPEDLVEIYLKAVRDEKLTGAYNAVAPEHLTQKDLMRALSRKLNKVRLSVPVPSFIMRIILGEMSVIALKGSRVSADKITDTGFEYKFGKIDKCLDNVLR